MVVALRRAFVAASLTWAALLVLVPFLASRSHASNLDTAIVVAVYGVGSLVCHQLPARSFRLWNTQLPVCARCTGIYVGAAACAAWVAARGRRSGAAPSHIVGAGAPVARVLAVAGVPTAATLVYEWTTGDMPSNALRFVAGIPLGIVVVWLVVSATADQVN